MKPGYCTLKNGLLLLSLFISAAGYSQSQNYDDFEGNKVIHYVAKTGTLDTAFKNPAPDSINKSARCAKYIRNAKHKYDYIKLRPAGTFANVAAYTSFTGGTPAIKMKVYTNAPAGTLVEIQLGKISATPYPAGTHSQFQAFTTVSNRWQELDFRYIQTPAGSETTAEEVNQITIMFDPESGSRYTFYFDDLSGPPVAPGALTATNHNTNKKKK